MRTTVEIVEAVQRVEREHDAGQNAYTVRLKARLMNLLDELALLKVENTSLKRENERLHKRLDRRDANPDGQDE